MLNFVYLVLLLFHIHIMDRLMDRQRTAEMATHDQLIIWNIGQGQWVSLSTENSCFHFDMGGEHTDWPKISDECGSKNNIAYFSHWDIDHLSFARLAPHYLRSFCVAAMPRGPVPSTKKLKVFSNLVRCVGPPWVEEVFSLPNSVLHFTSNDYSRVFEINAWALAQGDSPKKQEKLWSQELVSAASIRIIVLGHHGSRTSTSEELLSGLPGLKMAISSARQARYGHPHQEVLDRLKKFGVACLRTEYWGNIHIEMPQNRKAHLNAPFAKN